MPLETRIADEQYIHTLTTFGTSGGGAAAPVDAADDVLAQAYHAVVLTEVVEHDDRRGQEHRCPERCPLDRLRGPRSGTQLSRAMPLRQAQGASVRNTAVPSDAPSTAH